MAIIAIMAMLLLQTLAGAKERARRVNCKNSQRQLILAVHLYGDENEQRLPSGAPNYPMPATDDHLPVLSAASSNSIVQYLYNKQMVHCPNFAEYFLTHQIFDEQAYGYVIGFNYHGGHTNTPWPSPPRSSATWISPQKLTDASTLVLISDLNDWSPGYGQSFAPHGKAGAILLGGDQPYRLSGTNIPSSAAIGGTGGNLGLMDGSVSWKKIKQMRVYRGSQLWNDKGCWAMW